MLLTIKNDISEISRVCDEVKSFCTSNNIRYIVKNPAPIPSNEDASATFLALALSHSYLI